MRDRAAVSRGVTSWRVLPVLALLGSLSFWLGMEQGRRDAVASLEADPASALSLQDAVTRLQGELAQVQAALDVQLTRNEVDRQALEMLRADMATRKDQVAELEEDLRFYRGLMAPEGVADGLSLRPAEIVAGPVPGRYDFRFVIQQSARKHELVKGDMVVEVWGLQGDEERRYALSELSAEVEGVSIPLSFRYFQAVTGEMTLPEGLQPRGILVIATASRPRKTEVREHFPWELQERFSHAGN